MLLMMMSLLLLLICLFGSTSSPDLAPATHSVLTNLESGGVSSNFERYNNHLPALVLSEFPSEYQPANARSWYTTHVA